MLDFSPLKPEDKALYDAFLLNCGERGCEYNFANLFLWGRQKATIHNGNLAFFCQFNRRSVYLFPIGADLKPTLDAIIADAKPLSAKNIISARWESLLLFIPGAMTTTATIINVYDILNHDKFIVDKSAVEKIQEVFA